MAALLPFQPETDIERRILDVRLRKYPADALMLELSNAELCIPSQTKTQGGWRGYVPVLLEQNGIVFVAVFTTASRQTRDFAPHLLRADGRSFVQRLPAGY
ncbi:MAG TPA: hypothetical protein VNN98_02080, partial [Rhizomicrobium sp.]|nr:hypothetical protein [Rhizomicrobium sp.]